MSLRNQERLRLYYEGMNDTQIARIQGVDKSAVRGWRKCRNLESNRRAWKANAAASGACRWFLYQLRWSDLSIARHQGVSDQAVAQWRKRFGLPAHGLTRPSFERDRSAQLVKLNRRVAQAIGTSLPPDIAADAAAELMLAVVEGTVALADIEKVARSFGNKALQAYADGFKFTS